MIPILPEDRENWTVTLLGELPGIAGASPEVLARLAPHFKIVEYADGAWLCEEDAVADRMFVLGEGEVAVVKRASDGRRFTVSELSPGVLFGHVGVVTRQGRTAGCRAQGEVRVVEILANTTRELLRSGAFDVASRLRRAMIVALARQVHSADASAMRLAVEAGAAETEARDQATVPSDAEERLLGAQSQV